jgi:hypothetical protein
MCASGYTPRDSGRFSYVTGIGDVNAPKRNTPRSFAHHCSSIVEAKSFPFRCFCNSGFWFLNSEFWTIRPWVPIPQTVWGMLAPNAALVPAPPTAAATAHRTGLSPPSSIFPPPPSVTAAAHPAATGLATDAGPPPWTGLASPLAPAAVSVSATTSVAVAISPAATALALAPVPGRATATAAAPATTRAPASVRTCARTPD